MLRPHSTDVNGKSHQAEQQDAQAAESRLSRRRALLVGLATAPAILTLIRRPVWAQTIIGSPDICASLAAGTSLHALEQQTLKEKCETTGTTTTSSTTTFSP